MRNVILILPFLVVPLSAHAQLSLVDSGSGINEQITITSNINSVAQWKVIFSAADSWGMSDWYDLVNDPNSTTNLLLGYSVSGPSVPCFRANGLAQLTLYGDNDYSPWNYHVTGTGGCSVSATATVSTLLNTGTLIIIQASANPSGPTTLDTNILVTNTYYVYANGEIYVHQAVTATNAQNMAADNFIIFVGLNDPSGGSSTATTSGWIRATNSQNPYSYATPWEHYAFTFWNSSDPSNPNFTKASILVIPGTTATALWGSIGGHILHGWTCGNGCGVQRWGFRTSTNDTTFNLSMGQTVQWDDLYQLGTQGSSYLPNITTSTTPNLIYAPYAVPPTLTLTNATGGTWTLQGGYWTVARTSDPVTISANAALYNPAYLISTWGNGAPSTITVNGVTKNIGVDYSASKYDSSHLIIQYLDGAIGANQNVVLSMPAQGNPVLSPIPAVAYAGQAITISCTTNCGTSGTWACTGCAGALSGATNTSVTYTASASTITPQSSVLGYQFLPNNHIYNTNISGLSLNGNSATWTAGLTQAGLNFLAEFTAIPVQNGPTTPTDQMSFYYTQANNGPFPAPQFPKTAGMEGSWYGMRQSDNTRDHHFISGQVPSGNSTPGQLSELYQYYCTMPAASASQSGTVVTVTPGSTPLFGANPLTCGLVNGRQVCIGNFTGADTWANVCPATITAVNSTSFQFALASASRSTTTTGNFSAYNGATDQCTKTGSCTNSQSGILYTVNDYPLPSPTTDAAGLEIEPLTLHFQEFEEAVINSGSVNHALRFTVSAGGCAPSFLWPATTAGTNCGTNMPFGARMRLKSTFNCGFQNGVSGATFSVGAQIICTMLKNYGLILSDTGLNMQAFFSGTWTPTYIAYLTEIQNAALKPSANFEVVDESGLMVSSSSGETTNNREDVVFTRNDSVTATLPVTLRGVAVNMQDDQLLIMAGTPAQQLVAFVSGAANLGLNWTMSPTVGSLGATTGIYTAPANQATPTTTTVTACSAANSAICSVMVIWVFPGAGDANPGIRIIPASTTDYTDASGKLWKGQFGLGLTNIAGVQGCCQAGYVSGSADLVNLWGKRLFSSLTSGDYFMNQFRVPAGKYTITYNNGTSVPAGSSSRFFGAQGVQIAGPVDETAVAGLNQPYTLAAIVTVASDNKISFYSVSTGNQTNESGDVSSFSITPITITGSQVLTNSIITRGVSVQ